MARTKLSEAQIKTRMRKLKGWKREGDYLAKKFKFKTFLEAVGFMNRVFAAAEEKDHHPDLYNVWASVTLKWSTHDKGGLTDWDFEMAAKCDSLE